MFQAYHNTTKETGAALKMFRYKAISQDRAVFNLFSQRNELMTAEKVKEVLIATEDIKSSVPITSIRRALSDLKNIGALSITNHKKIGSHGRPIHYYSLSQERKSWDEWFALLNEYRAKNNKKKDVEPE